MAEAVDLVVDGGVLFDISIGGSDIGLRLVIVVIGDEVFHAAVREERTEFAAQLSCQRFVMRDHQRGLLHPLNDRGHGEGFARARHAEQHLTLQSLFKSPCQRRNCLRLVAARLIRRFQHKPIHPHPSSNRLYHENKGNGRGRRGGQILGGEAASLREAPLPQTPSPEERLAFELCLSS